MSDEKNELSVDISSEIKAILKDLGINEPEKYVQSVVRGMKRSNQKTSDPKLLSKEIKTSALKTYVQNYVSSYTELHKEGIKENPGFENETQRLLAYASEYNQVQKSEGNKDYSIKVNAKDVTIEFTGTKQEFDALVKSNPHYIISGKIIDGDKQPENTKVVPKELKPSKSDKEAVMEKGKEIVSKIKARDVESGIKITESTKESKSLNEVVSDVSVNFKAKDAKAKPKANKSELNGKYQEVLDSVAKDKVQDPLALQAVMDKTINDAKEAGEITEDEKNKYLKTKDEAIKKSNEKKAEIDAAKKEEARKEAEEQEINGDKIR